MRRSLIVSMVRVCRAYARAHGRLPRLIAARRYTEKMQLRKLFDLNPLFPTLCDKLAAREHIAGRVGGEYLVPLLWTGTPSDIPFDRLEPPFVLKSTHASGHVIFIDRGDVPDRATIRAQTERWLATDYGTRRNEPGYSRVPPLLVIEKTVVTKLGERPQELRLFVFDGKVAVINTVLSEGGKTRNGAFYTPQWERLGWYFTRNLDRDFTRPHRLGEMIGLAERLGAGLDHVRVDIYDCGDRIFVGELTLYSWSGYAHFAPDEADFTLGAYWRRPAPSWRAIARMLVGGRRFPP